MAEPIRSMPPTKAYEDNWERVFAPKPRQPEPKDNTYFYPNGCPILPSGPQRDDL
jgi:hypothetical protein